MCPKIASARVHLVFNYICCRPLRPARLVAWAPACSLRPIQFICKVHFDAALDCSDLELNCPPVIYYWHLLAHLLVFIYACINFTKIDRVAYMKSSEMISSSSVVTVWLKIYEIFTLDARIAFDKHRKEFLQTHRRTFICRGATLGFTPTSHSARRRIGTHLYWRWMLYYLFVCGCGRRCRGFDFFQSVGNAEGVQVGASGVRSLRPGAGPVADREPIKRARVR